MRRKVMETQKRAMSRGKKSPGKQNSAFFPFTPIQQSLKLLKKTHNETIDL